MTTKKTFDVLIVYSETLATSASSQRRGNTSPFALSYNKNYDQVYSYFLEACAAYNLSAAFTTSADITGSGTCRSYWLFQGNTWIKINKPGYSALIFDKFFPLSKKLQNKRAILFSSSVVKSFTNEYLFNLFFDKLETSAVLNDFSVPTVEIKSAQLESINQALTQLTQKMTNNADDFTGNLILKDRYGAGGFNVYKIETEYAKNILKIMRKNKKTSFIIQPFVKFDRGYQYKRLKGSTEIRLIYLKNRIVQTYIRVAGNADFLCNHGSGGIWITKTDIPQNVLDRSKEIVNLLNTTDSLFALDFIVSNNNTVYLLEGNISPGIDWYSENPINEKMNKTMIKIIIKELVLRTNTSYPTALDINLPQAISLPIIPLVIKAS